MVVWPGPWLVNACSLKFVCLATFKPKSKHEGSEWRAAIEVLMMIIGSGGYAGAHHARLAWTTRASVQEKDKRIKLQRFARIAKLSLTRSRPRHSTEKPKQS